MFLSIIAGLVGGTIGILIVNKLTTPLTKLNKKVSDFSKGKKVDFKFIDSSDEISILENTLKELQDSLNSETKLKDMAEEKVKIALRIFDQSLEGILITDDKNKIVLVNKAFTDITGYTQEEVYQKNPAFLNSGIQSKEFYENMWKEILENGKWQGKLSNLTKDGRVYHEDLRISTLKDLDGNVINYLATFNSSF